MPGTNIRCKVVDCGDNPESTHLGQIDRRALCWPQLVSVAVQVLEGRKVAQAICFSG